MSTDGSATSHPRVAANQDAIATATDRPSAGLTVREAAFIGVGASERRRVVAHGLPIADDAGDRFSVVGHQLAKQQARRFEDRFQWS